MEGFEDPFNRQTYPWGKEDRELLDWYRALGKLRKEHTALRRGELRFLAGQGRLLAFLRRDTNETILCAFNAGEEAENLTLPLTDPLTPLLGRAGVTADEDGVTLQLPPRSGVAFRVK